MTNRKKKTAVKQQPNNRVITSNRQAFFNYEILERYEAGLALTGTEIKSVRAGKVDLREAYARPMEGELWLLNAHIAQYDPASIYNHGPAPSPQAPASPGGNTEDYCRGRPKGFDRGGPAPIHQEPRCESRVGPRPGQAPIRQAAGNSGPRVGSGGPSVNAGGSITQGYRIRPKSENPSFLRKQEPLSLTPLDSCFRRNDG